MSRLKDLLIRIGSFQARLILAVFYFTLLAPFALAARWFADPLDLQRPGWLERDDAPEERSRAQH